MRKLSACCPPNLTPRPRFKSIPTFKTSDTAADRLSKGATEPPHTQSRSAAQTAPTRPQMMMEELSEFLPIPPFLIKSMATSSSNRFYTARIRSSAMDVAAATTMGCLFLAGLPLFLPSGVSFIVPAVGALDDHTSSEGTHQHGR